MSSIMRARSAVTGWGERGEVIGGFLSSWRLLDLQCSGSHAPIVTPYRSSTHRQRQKCTGPDAALPRERVRSRVERGLTELIHDGAESTAQNTGEAADLNRWNGGAKLSRNAERSSRTGG